MNVLNFNPFLSIYILLNNYFDDNDGDDYDATECGNERREYNIQMIIFIKF